MTMYVYGTDGEPRGFLFETTIFDLDGSPLGRILGCRVHRFDGGYAGEWFHHMVVERPTARPRMIPAVEAPPARPPARAASPRRHVAEYGLYADAFDRLYAGAGADRLYSEAAE